MDVVRNSRMVVTVHIRRRRKGSQDGSSDDDDDDDDDDESDDDIEVRRYPPSVCIVQYY